MAGAITAALFLEQYVDTDKASAVMKMILAQFDILSVCMVGRIGVFCMRFLIGSIERNAFLSAACEIANI